MDNASGVVKEGGENKSGIYSLFKVFGVVVGYLLGLFLNVIFLRSLLDMATKSITNVEGFV